MITRVQALEKLFSSWCPQPQTEIIPMELACGRISAEPLRSQNSLPVVRASKADGFAVRSDCFKDGTPDTSGWELGIDYERADTGDDFDDRFDAVIRVEDASVSDDGTLKFSDDIKVGPGSMVSGAGSWIREDDFILDRNMCIRPCDMAVLAQGGIAEVKVFRKPVIAFIPTGSELIPAGQPPQRGQNIDANSILAQNMLNDMGAEVLCYPIVKDIEDELSAAISAALKAADIVIVNGGSSKGNEDYNAKLLKQKGRLICHGVRAVPGRPICIVLIDGKPGINIPGPMLAAYYCMDWCMRAVIAHYLDTFQKRKPTVQAVLTSDLHTPIIMEMLCKMRVRKTEQGYEADPITLKAAAEMKFAGFPNGQFISQIGTELYPKGSVITVELLQ